MLIQREPCEFHAFANHCHITPEKYKIYTTFFKAFQDIHTCINIQHYFSTFRDMSVRKRLFPSQDFYGNEK